MLRFSQECTKLTSTRDEYGDYSLSADETIPCLFRDISDVTIAGNQQVVDLDAILWTGPEAGLNKNDIIIFEGAYYKIDRKIVARDRLRSNAVQFLKFELKVQRQVS